MKTLFNQFRLTNLGRMEIEKRKEIYTIVTGEGMEFW
jgi:hypothetical protein